MLSKYTGIFLKKSALFITASFATLFLMEIVLRLTYSQYANYNTEMWRYATKLKQRSTFQGMGHEHKPNKKVKLYGAEIKTNSIGFRADREYSLNKPKGIRRIIILGDSVTMGWGVAYENTYPKVLESLLNNNAPPKFEVLNTGVGNYNTVSELAALKKFIRLDPDVIILGYYINDIEELNYPSKAVYFLGKTSYVYAFILDKIINIKYQGKRDYTHFYSGLYRKNNLKTKLKSAIIEMIHITEKKGIPFVFINIPDFHNFETYPFTAANKFIEEEVIKGEKIIYINLLPTFQDLGIHPSKLWVSGEDSHPNAVAHKIIADKIFDQIQHREFITKMN